MPVKRFLEDSFRNIPDIFRAYNLNDSLHSGTLSEDLYKNFVNEWMQESTMSGEDPATLFDGVTTASNSAGVPYFRFRCPVSPILNPSDFIATTIKAEHLSSLIHADQRDDPYGDILNCIDEFSAATSQRDKYRFENEIFNSIDTLSNPADRDGLMTIDSPGFIKGDNGSGGPRNQPVWFTTYGNSECNSSGCWTERSRWSARSNLTRNILALSHLFEPSGSGVMLATLIVPVSAIPSRVRITRPTPLDGSGDRFKSAFGDLRIRAKSDSWGRTVDLRKIRNERPHQGGYEIVTENFQPLESIRFTVLGYTRWRGDDKNSNEDFYKSLARNRKDSTIIDRLVKRAT